MFIKSFNIGNFKDIQTYITHKINTQLYVKSRSTTEPEGCLNQGAQCFFNINHKQSTTAQSNKIDNYITNTKLLAQYKIINHGIHFHLGFKYAVIYLFQYQNDSQ